MDLKDRFNNHQTEVDAEAWAHFQLLRRNESPKKHFFWWFLPSSGLFLLLAGLVFWQWNISNINYQNIESTTKSSVINKVPNNNPINEKEQSATITPISEKETSQESLTNSIPKVSSASIKNAKIKSKTNSALETSTNQNPSSTTNNTADFNSKKSVHRNNNLVLEDSPLLSYETNSLVLDTIALAVKNASTGPKFAAIESPLIRLLNIPDTSESIILPIIKPLRRTKNTFKLTLGHANAFINGFSTENPVDKRGFSIQATYYHEWNKIIGTGITAGYFKTIDRENPSFQIKDREIVKHIHAEVYLFLYNEKKHKLYAKIGAGLTNTDRILAGFFIPANGPTERIFQINNLTGIGYSVAGVYEYQLKNNFSIGVNYGFVAHNDGAQIAGLSIGYQF